MPPRRPPPQTITAWSYSRWNTYEQCPRKAKYQIIDRKKVAQNAAMKRGADIHSMAEQYVKGRMPALPKELELFDDEFHQLAELYSGGELQVDAEGQWAFKSDWTTCDWFGKATWLRLVVDLAVYNEADNRLTIIDYKTGKIREGYDDQLKLYAGAAFAKYPNLEEVKTELWYLDQGEIIGGNDDTGEGIYGPEEGDKFISYWTKKVKPMMVDKTFAPRPSALCRWCDFSQEKGGPCEY